MAKRPKPGKCVHCLNDPLERNWDHVFPESWYPDSTPANLAKWKVPSCIPCNDALGIIEDEFLQLVSVCLDPNNPASSSIVEKAKRARDPDSTDNETEKKCRQAAKDKLYSQLLLGSDIPNKGVYPTLNDKWDTPKEDRVAVKLPKGHFIKITEKIVRGIFLLEDKKFIEPPYTVDFFALGDAGTEPIRELLAKNGKQYAREPGIRVQRALATDGLSSAFEIDFWEQFQTHATVTRGP